MRSHKVDMLKDLLKDEKPQKSYIFGETKRTHLAIIITVMIVAIVACYGFYTLPKSHKNQGFYDFYAGRKTQLKEEDFQRPETSQAYAHVTGANFENQIVEIAKSAGYPLVSVDPSEVTEDKILIENPTFDDITGREGKSDFLLIHGKERTRFEALWQQSAGSIDLRIGHYFIMAQTNVYPEGSIALIVGGPGWRKGLLNWYKTQAEQQNKNAATKIFILNLDEFLIWMNNL